MNKPKGNKALDNVVKVKFGKRMIWSYIRVSRTCRMAARAVMSSVMALAFTILSLGASLAHEVIPAIADMRQDGDVLRFDIRMGLEGVLAGINLTNVVDTNDSPEAAQYEALRALNAEDFTAKARAYWPKMADGITVEVDGVVAALTLVAVNVETGADPALPRNSTLGFTVTVPEGAREARFKWDASFGGIVLRQQGVEEPYTGFLQAGAASDPITLSGGGAQTGWQAFVSYIPVGFDHILPKGLDHILFVLGLFFLSTRMRPLITQITTFTVAHTITLAMAALGWVTVPASIVEPLIAASIVFVAVENIFTQGLSRWRPVLIFGFGLLHGLGFASVLGEFGLPAGAFIPALIGFNIGVEIGQLTVIAAAFLAVGLWFGRKEWYRRVISIPASIAIALMGGWWVVERTLL